MLIRNNQLKIIVSDMTATGHCTLFDAAPEWDSGSYIK
jgi:hypothetical protein